MGITDNPTLQAERKASLALSLNSLATFLRIPDFDPDISRQLSVGMQSLEMSCSGHPA